MSAQKAELTQSGVTLNIAGLLRAGVGPNLHPCGSGKNSNQCVRDLVEHLKQLPAAQHPSTFDMDDTFLRQSEKSKQRKRKEVAQERLRAQRDRPARARKLNRADSVAGPPAAPAAEDAAAGGGEAGAAAGGGEAGADAGGE